jgi:ABC-type polysaccharide/polyol phosphate export permease
MRSAAAVIGLLWGLLNLLASYLMVTSAFLSKTAAKEGIASQASLLLGGIAIGYFTIALLRQCALMLRERGSGRAGPGL